MICEDGKWALLGHSLHMEDVMKIEAKAVQVIEAPESAPTSSWIMLVGAAIIFVGTCVKVISEGK